MNIVVYTKKTCPYCLSAKVWLEARNYTYQEISLDKPDDHTAFKAANPTLKTVPQIFVDGNSIGGFSELLRSNL